MNYKTPGVYVEEIPLFPPSVAQVETAIPAFIGYTAAALDNDGNPVPGPNFPYIKRIKSMLEYEQHFGTSRPQLMEVVVENDEPVAVNITTESVYRMYYALQMFFANGGGPCYIASVGVYSETGPESVALGDLQDGLAAIAMKDEPTLLLFPDAPGIDGANPAAQLTNYHQILQDALAQCNKLGDRFLICDLFTGDSLESSVLNDFRTGIGSNFLKYGAAYHPWLRTNISYYYNNNAITFDASDPSNTNTDMDNLNLGDIAGRQEAEEQMVTATEAQTEVNATTDPETAKNGAIKAAQAAVSAAIAISSAPNSTGDAATALTNANQALTDANQIDLGGVDPVADAQGIAQDAVDAITLALSASSLSEPDLDSVEVVYTNAFENSLQQLLLSQYVTMPPSSAAAGVYAMIDSTRGVWKAPANVSLTRVIEPMVKITNSDQDGMNISPTGKSINAIRAFAGKGILIWGARTLAGNDNEWRYVPVRRFFNMAEESIKKATEGFVFEPNDANTWVKVRAMIENFLILQWRAGALAGATPQEAFFVRIGLGLTMTPLDILEGRMNVEIGMAVVRPAEFIILKFSHKMQES